MRQPAILVLNTGSSSLSFGLFDAERGGTRLAVKSAVERVTNSVRSTLHAASLTLMARRGQIAGAMVDGPLAFDNAVALGLSEQVILTSRADTEESRIASLPLASLLLRGRRAQSTTGTVNELQRILRAAPMAEAGCRPLPQRDLAK